MESALSRAVPDRLRLSVWWVQPHERVILAFFTLVGMVSLLRPFPLGHRLGMFAIPALLCLVWRMEAQLSRPATRIAREWCSLPLMLCAYWSMELFAQSHFTHWSSVRWLAWDRALLYDWGVKAGIESLGGAIPGVLESVYFLLYSLPPLALGALYVCGERRKAWRFLTVMFLGTLTAYAMLPLLRVISPRIAYPGEDLPAYAGLSRRLNEWLLDHLDITTSVFPSGHVAVAFSCAYGLHRAAPGRRRLWATFFIVAFLVFVATVYGRYHYALDGVASMLIATCAWGLTERIWGDGD